jgi:hypothetical protein
MNNRYSLRPYLVWFCIIVAVTCLGVLAAPVVAATTMTVISRTPRVNQLNVAVVSNIAVTFNTNINNATISASTFNMDGSLSGKIEGAYSTTGDIVAFNPISYFKIGETVTVTLTTGIQSITRNTLISPVTWHFMVDVLGGYSTFPSEVNFGQVGNQSPLSKVLGDMDGDGDLDNVVENSGR